MATTFPKNEKNYAVLLTAGTTLAKMQTIAKALSRADADNLVVWSIAPFDAKAAAAWSSISSVWTGIARHQTVFEQVTQQEVDEAAAAKTVTVVS